MLYILEDGVSPYKIGLLLGNCVYPSHIESFVCSFILISVCTHEHLFYTLGYSPIPFYFFQLSLFQLWPLSFFSWFLMSLWHIPTTRTHTHFSIFPLLFFLASQSIPHWTCVFSALVPESAITPKNPWFLSLSNGIRNRNLGRRHAHG